MPIQEKYYTDTEIDGIIKEVKKQGIKPTGNAVIIVEPMIQAQTTAGIYIPENDLNPEQIIDLMFNYHVLIEICDSLRKPESVPAMEEGKTEIFVKIRHIVGQTFTIKMMNGTFDENNVEQYTTLLVVPSHMIAAVRTRVRNRFPKPVKTVKKTRKGGKNVELN